MIKLPVNEGMVTITDLDRFLTFARAGLGAQAADTIAVTAVELTYTMTGAAPEGPPQ